MISPFYQDRNLQFFQPVFIQHSHKYPPSWPLSSVCTLVCVISEFHPILYMCSDKNRVEKKHYFLHSYIIFINAVPNQLGYFDDITLNWHWSYYPLKSLSFLHLCSYVMFPLSWTWIVVFFGTHTIYLPFIPVKLNFSWLKALFSKKHYLIILRFLWILNLLLIS